MEISQQDYAYIVGCLRRAHEYVCELSESITKVENDRQWTQKQLETMIAKVERMGKDKK